MNGRCEPVSNSLDELAARGGYMTAAAGLALKNLYNKSTAANQISTEAYTINFSNNSWTEKKGVSKSGHTARGQINIRRGSGAYKGTAEMTVKSNTVTNTRYIEDASIQYTSGQSRFTEIYF